ncbi:SDR family NAD(P)-dependent oxidoreductase [Paraburkholderia sp. GAS334]|uniref:SDR family NAD(P)-dependent oxidoreductase n=1 Tax=Paraburkholderia sp. GAS334 TaxID=3035131 RepID=UPI003D25AD53
MSKLAGKTAFVTGAGGGIGLAMAKAFAAEGAVVAMADINAPLLENAARSLPTGRGVPVVCDVTDRLAVKAAVDGFCELHGGLDILVNNAVKFHYAPLVDMPEVEVDRMLSVGIKGVLWSLQAATPHMIKRRGSVINLSSVAVSLSIRNGAVYTAIKGAIDALTRQQAVELGEYGVRVNAIAPGPVDTPGASSVIDAQGWADRRARTPLKHLASVEEVAAAALFLASNDAASITGVTLKIDAGVTVMGP